MLKLILLVPAAALLVFAGEGIYHATSGRQPVTMACDQLTTERPPSPRVVVTGCEINYAGAGYRESGGQVDGAVPARAAGGRASRAGADRHRHARSRRHRLGAKRLRCGPGPDQRTVARGHAESRRRAAGVDVDRRARQDRRHRAAAIAADPVRPGAADRGRCGHRRSARHAEFRAGPALPSFWARCSRFLPFGHPGASVRLPMPAASSSIPSALPPPVLRPELASSQFDPELAFDEVPRPSHAPMARAGATPKVDSRVAAAPAPARARCVGRTRGDRDRAAARVARRGRRDPVRRHPGSRRRSPARRPGAP